MRIPIYSRDMTRIGTIRHASKVGYKRMFNDLHTASFEIPADDDADNDLCETVHGIVDIVDGDKSVGKYRICDQPESDITGEGEFIQYELEHVIAFLFDDRIDGYLEMGGTGVYTEDIIRHLLRLQTVKRWQLGRCDFRYQFQYSWEKEDLLNALFSIPKCFDSDYHWTYDTDSYPWTISLVRADDARNCEVRYGRNEQSIKRGRDISNLCTRLYCMGSGEGVNQTSIRTVNPTGKSYIDSPNISKYGVISKLLTDSSISDEATLFAKGKAYLRELENPMYSYTVKALDFHRVTGLEWDLIDEGKLVRLNDTRAKLDLDKRIVSVEKSDIEGNPLDMTVEIATQSSDVSSTLESISAKTAITAQYAQGATNLYAMQASDNADASHPAVMNFYVPTACAKINQVLLSWKLENFRAYETGAAAGGGDVRTTQEGGGSTQTSEAGGATTVSVPQRTVAQAITSGTPMQDGAVNANTGFAKTFDGDNMSNTGVATGTTGMSAEMNTGISRNEAGAMMNTDAGGGGSTQSGGGGNTGVPRNEAGPKLSTDSGGSGSTGSGGGGSTGAPQNAGGAKLSTDSGGGGSTGSGGGGSTGAPQNAGGAKLSTDSGGSGTSGGSGELNTKTNTVDISVTSSGAGTTGGGSGDTGDASPGTDSQGSHSHTVNSHSHTFSFSIGIGHNHKLSTGASATGAISSGVTKVSADKSTGTKSPGTDSQGSHSHTVNAHHHSIGSHTHSTPNHTHSLSQTAHKHSIGSHTHSIPAHTHGMSHWHNFDAHSHTVPAHTHGMSHWHNFDAHSHTVSAHTHGMSHWHTMDAHTHGLSSHTHGMSHWHTIDGHTHPIGNHVHDITHRHEFSHYHMVNVAVTVPAISIEIPAHTHKVSVPAHSHSFTLPSHTHEIQYGIYEGDIASSVTIRVDGEEIPAEKVNGNEIDVIPYLSKDSNGRIMRGTWHEVSVVPDKLTRIRANLFVQTFVTSYTGGNY